MHKECPVCGQLYEPEPGFIMAQCFYHIISVFLSGVVAVHVGFGMKCESCNWCYVGSCCVVLFFLIIAIFQIFMDKFIDKV